MDYRMTANKRIRPTLLAIAASLGAVLFAAFCWNTVFHPKAPVGTYEMKGEGSIAALCQANSINVADVVEIKKIGRRFSWIERRQAFQENTKSGHWFQLPPAFLVGDEEDRTTFGPGAAGLILDRKTASAGELYTISRGIEFEPAGGKLDYDDWESCFFLPPECYASFLGVSVADMPPVRRFLLCFSSCGTETNGHLSLSLEAADADDWFRQAVELMNRNQKVKQAKQYRWIQRDADADLADDSDEEYTISAKGNIVMLETRFLRPNWHLELKRKYFTAPTP
jgi:hypothetical protein